jgi:methyl-accepting chemotaxis protein
MEEQGSATQEISRNVDEVSGQTKKVVADIEEISRAG